MKNIRWVVAAFALVAIVAGIAATTAVEARKPPSGGGCLCPDVFDPVICSDGNTYPNFCYAGCAGATGCVRTGDI